MKIPFSIKQKHALLGKENLGTIKVYVTFLLSIYLYNICVSVTHSVFLLPHDKHINKTISNKCSSKAINK